MRRKAKALVRWKKRTGACNERAIRAFIRHFNRKFYDNPKQHEVTWCRWYFPTITTSKSLHVLDEYMISCIRYIATGKHTKANFNLRYDEIKELEDKQIIIKEGKHYKTNVIVITAECADEMERAVTKYHKLIADKIEVFIWQTSSEYKSIGFVGSDFSENG